MKPTNRYTVEVGRTIYRDGQALLLIRPSENLLSFSAADSYVRLICDLLNDHENRPAPSSTVTR